MAAITIPALLQSSSDAGIVSQLKKDYSAFSSAFSELQADGVDIDELFSGEDSAAVLNRFATKLSIIKNCGDTGFDCFPESAYLEFRNSTYITITGGAVLADGSTIAVWDFPESGCTSIIGTGRLENTCGYLYVDANGLKKPNICGRDLFIFHITRTGIIPAGTPADDYNTCDDDDYNTFDDEYSYGRGCATYVLTKNALPPLIYSGVHSPEG